MMLCSTGVVAEAALLIPLRHRHNVADTVANTVANAMLFLDDCNESGYLAITATSKGVVENPWYVVQSRPF